MGNSLKLIDHELNFMIKKSSEIAHIRIAAIVVSVRICIARGKFSVWSNYSIKQKYIVDAWFAIVSQKSFWLRWWSEIYLLFVEGLWVAFIGHRMSSILLIWQSINRYESTENILFVCYMITNHGYVIDFHSFSLAVIDVYYTLLIGF